jgi:hypothetical protein
MKFKKNYKLLLKIGETSGQKIDSEFRSLEKITKKKELEE